MRAYSVASLPALKPWAPAAERGPSLKSIYRGSLTVDLCEGNKIIIFKKIISPQPLKKKKFGGPEHVPSVPIVKDVPGPIPKRLFTPEFRSHCAVNRRLYTYTVYGRARPGRSSRLGNRFSTLPRSRSHQPPLVVTCQLHLWLSVPRTTSKHAPTPQFLKRLNYSTRWLVSRVVSVLDSGAVGPAFKSQPRRCRVTVLCKLFTPIVPLFTKQRG